MTGISSEQRKRRGRGKPFEPGQSGNPSGRPKEFGDFRKWARDVGVENAKAVLLRVMTKGNDKDAVAAARVILAYALGQPTQAVELATRDGLPLSLNVHFVKPSSQR